MDIEQMHLNWTPQLYDMIYDKEQALFHYDMTGAFVFLRQVWLLEGTISTHGKVNEPARAPGGQSQTDALNMQTLYLVHQQGRSCLRLHLILPGFYTCL
jgi:hypothetical protein